MQNLQNSASFFSNLDVCTTKGNMINWIMNLFTDNYNYEITVVFITVAGFIMALNFIFLFIHFLTDMYIKNKHTV